MSATDDADFIRGRAREADPDRYVSALFAPAELRPKLFALYAFNAEIARIPELAREPALGQIRLQWWRDALAARASTGNPIADAVRGATSDAPASRDRLTELIDAHQRDLGREGIPDREALLSFVDRTDGTLFAAAAELAGGDPGATRSATSAAGLAFGLTNLLRNHALHRARSTNVQDEARMAAELDDLPSLARQALADARREVMRLPNPVRTVFLPLALVEAYLAMLEKPQHKTNEDVIRLAPLSQLWRITRAAMTGRV